MAMPTSLTWRMNSSPSSSIRNPGITSLSRVPPVWPRPRPLILREQDGGHDQPTPIRGLVAQLHRRVLVDDLAA